MAAGISNHIRYQDSNYVSGSVMEKRRHKLCVILDKF